MAESMPSYNRGVVKPVECLEAGWALVKDQYWLFVGMTAVGMLIGGLVPMGIVMGAMMCGIYLALFERMRGRRINFDLLFKGFDYFVDSLVATLLQFMPILAVLIPFYVLFFAGLFAYLPTRRGGTPPDAVTQAALMVGAGLLILVVVAIAIAVGVCFIFSYALIIDRKLSGIQAAKLSIKASFANFWGLLGLLLLNGLLSLVGALCCYVGAFLVLPVTFAAVATAYRQVFGLSEDQPPSVLSSS